MKEKLRLMAEINKRNEEHIREWKARQKVKQTMGAERLPFCIGR